MSRDRRRGVLGAMLGCLVALGFAPPAMADSVTIDFSATPGPNGILGDSDDVPLANDPAMGGDFAGNEFESVGISFSTPSLQLNLGCGTPTPCLGADNTANDFNGILVSTFTQCGVPSAVSALHVRVVNEFQASWTRLYSIDGSLVAEYFGSFSHTGGTPVARCETQLNTDAWDCVIYTLVEPPGPWCDLGNALAGTNGDPLLVGSGPLTAGSSVSIDLSNASPGAPAFVTIGFSAINAPFKGGVMVPYPDLLFGMTIDLIGGASLAGTWPGGVPSGFTTYFQWWIADAGGPSGFAASNAISGTAP